METIKRHITSATMVAGDCARLPAPRGALFGSRPETKSGRQEGEV